MNRALRRGMNKKNALRISRRSRRGARRGGGFSLYGPVVPFNPKNDWDFSVGRGEIARPGYNDCYFNARPGELFNQVTAQSLATAQTPMVGGRRRRGRKSRRVGGGCGCGLPAMNGGGCGCGMPRMNGGKRRGTKKHRGGGTYGFATDPNYSIGGNGPIAVPEYNPVPCDGIISPTHALNPPGPFLPDPRAPADLYSLYPTPAATEPTGYVPASLQSGGRRTRRNRNRKVRGGEYSSGNAYPERCYHAPGSSLPVYNASTAGFFFSPSTDKGVFEPDGVTGYMEVNPTAARVGGGKRRNRKSKKSKRTRKH
jgi:hypothetical protein